MTNKFEQCENEFRKGGGKWVKDRCSNRAKVTVWRVAMVDDKAKVQQKRVCGKCKNRMTTGRDRRPANPWKVKESKP